MAGQLWSRLAIVSILIAGCGYDGADGNSSYNNSTGPDGGSTSPYTGAPAAVLTANPRVLAGSGDLSRVLAEFRARLGEPSNRSAGEQPTGRREINWDGVAAALTNVNTFPPDFFNTTVPRGEVYSTESQHFRVSDNAFADLNPAYADQFSAFSPPKLFIAVGSAVLDVRFFVAGSTTPALVDGFGVVFSDVDREGSALLTFFNAAGSIIKEVRAPVRTDAAGHSFVGVTFDRPIVARVRIRSGQRPVNGTLQDVSAGGTWDLVTMDDFISGEPRAIR